MAPLSRRMFLVASAGVALAACTKEDSGAKADPSAGSAPTGTNGGTGSGPSTVGSPTTTVVETTEPTETTEVTEATEPVPTDAPSTTADLELSADPFTLGVASGDPDENSVVLWTRLAPRPFDGGGMPALDVDVQWELATDPNFDSMVATGTAIATAEHAHSVHVVARPPAGSGEVLHYRFKAGQYTSPVGLTRLAPTGKVVSARFVSASCQNYQDGFFTAHGDIVSQQPDFVLWLGDYIYEGGSATVGDGSAVRSHGAEEPKDLESYRNRYGIYKSDLLLQASHGACPWFVVWDDHEVENNYAGDIPQDAADLVGFSDRRRAAYQAWWEHQPVRLEPPPPAGEFRIYRDFHWGDLLGVALLDTRQYRADQACGDRTLNLDPACPETFEDRTFTGDEQERWLYETLGSHSTTWNVIAQQVVMSNLTLNGAVLNYDQWDGYPKNRDRVLQHLADASIPNVVVLSGDIHLAGVGVLRAGLPATGQAVAVEFVATSISSTGLVDPSVTDLVKSFPDIVDVELTHRGYTLHTASAESWTAEYRIVDSTRDLQSTVSTYKTFAIDAGAAAVRVVA